MAQQAKASVTRYHPVIALLHWVLAILIIGILMLGYFRIAPMVNSDPQKIGLLRLHMAGGMMIFALMAVRFLLRLFTTKPPAAQPLAQRSIGWPFSCIMRSTFSSCLWLPRVWPRQFCLASI